MFASCTVTRGSPTKVARSAAAVQWVTLDNDERIPDALSGKAGDRSEPILVVWATGAPDVPDPVEVLCTLRPTMRATRTHGVLSPSLSRDRRA